MRLNRALAAVGLGCGLAGLAPGATFIVPAPDPGLSAPTSGTNPEVLDRAPALISREEPVYPYALFRSGVQGQVVVDFVVDVHGNVINAQVIKSPHPDFEAPTIEAVLKWKFHPGEKDGQVVNARLRVPVAFEHPDWKDTGPNALEIPDRASVRVPENYRYDEPPQPVLTGPPVYPYELLRKKISGSATIAFAVDNVGQTHQIEVREATRPEFGAAAAAMMATWTFKPAKRAGRPCWALLEKKQVFDPNEKSHFYITQSAERLLAMLNKNPAGVATTDDLDGALKARYRPTVILPDVLPEEKPAEAEIEFIVDRTGHAQLPRIILSSHETFGWAAATAVSNWVFMPPTRNAAPVDVRLQFTVVYTPRKSIPIPEWEK